jgi:hypothetical protein
VTRVRIPEAVLSAAHDRAAARAAKDWPEADRIRAEIEAAGWKVVDRGTDFALEPAHASTVEDGGVVRYGTSSAVPSRLDDADAGVATVVLVATDWPDDVARALAGVRAHMPAGTSIVVVADGPSPEQDAGLPADDDAELEVVRTSARLGTGAAWNVGIRRASGQSVVILDGSVEPDGDVVTPLVAALDDPTVGVAGASGSRAPTSAGSRTPGRATSLAIEGYALAFRRK